MSILYNAQLRRVMLTLLAIWSAGSFWFFQQFLYLNIAVSVLSIFLLYFIWKEKFPQFTIIFLSFTSAFALYGFLFYFNFPLWVVMIALILIFGYLFMYLESRTGYFGGEALIYFASFILITLELFLFLSYMLISPINRSLLIALSVYLLSGYAGYIVYERKPADFRKYLLVFITVFTLIMVTSVWGG